MHDWTSDNAWRYAVDDVRIFNGYVKAMQERSIAISGGTASLGLRIASSVSNGAQLQYDASLGLAGWPALVSGISNTYVIPSAGISGFYANGFSHAFAATSYYTGSFAYGGTLNQTPIPFADCVLRRRYPRWINNIAATVDQNGAAAANGQHAMLTDNPDNVGTNSGQIFTRTAGVWAYDPAVFLPDTVVPPHSTNSGSSLFDLTYAGDYACWPEFLNELRDTINRFVMTIKLPSYGTDTFWNTITNDGSGTSLAACKADYNSGTNGVASNASPYLICTAVNSNPSYRIQGTYGTLVIGPDILKAAGFCNFKVHVCTYGSTAPTGGSYASHGDAVIDSNLTPNGTNSTWFWSSGITSATSVTTATFGSSTSPTSFPDGTIVLKDGYTVNGSVAATPIVIFTRYDVAGGFVYTKDTNPSF